MLSIVKHQRQCITYILGYNQIETSKDVTFDEDTTFSRSRQIRFEEVHEDPEAPRVTNTYAEEDMAEP